ncbi:MAG: GNAT family N-acetyltransferase [Chitinophagaceae bacterium]|nr:MAG: GNAT family N-acetyltransferase [Chitinophagaceae bacterium]
MKTAIRLRHASIDDVDALAALYRDTIGHINIRDYDEQQVAAWAGRSRNTESLVRRIGEQYFLVAHSGSKLTGFASITTDGTYLDFLYVHHEHQGEGIAGALYDTLEAYARSLRSAAIESDVSITARPFFEYKGFMALCRQEVVLDGVLLHNFRMRKELTY